MRHIIKERFCLFVISSLLFSGNWLGLMMSNPGAATSFSDHLFSYNVLQVLQTSNREPCANIWLYIFNNVHFFLVDLQLQVKIDTKTNTEPAGALAKQRQSLFPAERVGWERNTSGRGDKEAEEHRKTDKETNTGLVWVRELKEWFGVTFS